MAAIEHCQPGRFSWVDLATPNPASAKVFYSELFGWEMQDFPAEDAGTYTMCFLRGKSVAGLFELTPEMQAQHVPPHWMSYVSVADATAACDKAKSLGAEIVTPAFDVMDQGRMGVVRDPSGAVLSLWEAKTHQGSQLYDEPGAFCWNELVTHDLSAAEGFYRGLFGWTAKAEKFGTFDYTTFFLGEQPVGGLMAIDPSWGPVPPHWGVYFAVDSCDDTAERAQRNRANLMAGPQDIPRVGRFATLRDPENAAFSVLQQK